jgi:hypothetical protein
MDIQNNILYEMQKFWKWAKMNSREYASNNSSGEWETQYEGWPQIYAAVESFVEIFSTECEKIPREIVYSVLDAMAVDNECENILDIVSGNKLASFAIIEAGYEYYQPHSRWQVAELIFRIHGNDFEAMLEYMFRSDSDNYVRRRALLSLYRLNPDKGVACAEEYNEGDEKLQSVCNKILHNAI